MGEGYIGTKGYMVMRRLRYSLGTHRVDFLRFLLLICTFIKMNNLWQQYRYYHDHEIHIHRVPRIILTDHIELD